MQAIQTKLIPCTNFQPSRVKAWAEAGSVTVGWNDGLSPFENHTRAAKALLAKLGWNYTIQTGVVKNAYVHVLSLPKKRLFVWAAMEWKVSRTYGGSTVKVRIWEVVDGNMDLVAATSWCTRSYKGEDSEVMNALHSAGVIVGDEYRGYFNRYEMPIQIVGV